MAAALDAAHGTARPARVQAEWNVIGRLLKSRQVTRARSCWLTTSGSSAPQEPEHPPRRVQVSRRREGSRRLRREGRSQTRATRRDRRAEGHTMCDVA